VAATPVGYTWHDIEDAGTMMLAMTVKFCPACERYFRAGMLCWCGGDLDGESVDSAMARNRRDVRTAGEWRDLLRAALRAALRDRQNDAVAALRETLAAIDNAEAVDPSAAPPIQHGMIAGGVPGLGAGEVPRRCLSAEEVTAIVDREIDERRRAVMTYANLGREDEAAVFRRQVVALVALQRSGLPPPDLSRPDG
jgi:uncharacterized protein